MKQPKPASAKRKAKPRGKVQKVMHEYAAGELHSGSKQGPIVRTRRQAIAIAMSEQRKARQH